MSITRKPKPVNGNSPTKADVNALIAKGGSHARLGRGPGAFEADRGAEVPVIVRIPEADLFEVDTLVGQRAVKMPRHRWLLEAIHEKIVRERQGTRSDRRQDRA